METPSTALNIATSLWNQLVNAPSHLLLLIVLLFVGMLIKRSKVPNALIPWVLLALGAAGYPFLSSPANINPSFRHPEFVLCLYGGLIGIGAKVAHGFLRKTQWFCSFEGLFLNAFGEEDKPYPPTAGVDTDQTKL